MKLTTEDIQDIKTIVIDVQEIVSKAEYHNSQFAEFAYDVDMNMRAILEIINGPTGKVEKMIDRTDKQLRCNTCYRTIDSYFYRYFCKTCYDRGER